MHAADVMTTNVVTVTPDTTVRDLAELLGKHGISGVPVVDAGNTLIGIVSEGDLLHRAETGTDRRTEPRRSRWLDAFTGGGDPARDYIKSHGHTVRDVMTTSVVAVTETTGLDEIATLLETKRIKRVPVVTDGRIVGIVSRANLVRALATAKPASSGATPDDRSIRTALLRELNAEAWARVWAADIIVNDGVVHLWCSDDRTEDQRHALRVAAGNVAGVKTVVVHMVPVPFNPPL